MSAPVVFLSHSVKDPRDFALAHELAARLREFGAQVWIAPDSIPAGAEWEAGIVRGVLEDCTHFLVLLTPASSRSEWVTREVELARTRHAAADGRVNVLPIIVGEVPDSPVSAFLRRFQSIPWRENPAEQVYLVARALGISAAPAPLTDKNQALRFLDREKQWEEEEFRRDRRLRAIAPVVGLLFAPVGLLVPMKALAAATMLGLPLFTGAMGWAWTSGRIQQSAIIRRRLHTLRNGLDLCATVTSPSCRRIWDEFWRYAERSVGVGAQNDA
jgi:hypothetical protein